MLLAAAASSGRNLSPGMGVKSGVFARPASLAAAVSLSTPSVAYAFNGEAQRFIGTGSDD